MFLPIFFCCLSLCICREVKADANADCKKVALIFGASGQDGSYLTELLLSKNYDVHAVSRTGKAPQESSSQKGQDPACSLVLHAADASQSSAVMKLIAAIKPDEIYHLAAQSNVGASFLLPLETAVANAMSTLHILEGIKLLTKEKPVKFLQAVSSELFGQAPESPQYEKTPFHPSSPYGVSKLYSYWITVNYREAYGIFGCNAILFNHESPLRGEAFITRKITSSACRYKLGMQDVLYVGNLDARRDWGYAKDYVEAMWKMLQQDKPDDFVIATGVSHSVRDCIELAFKEVDVDIEWRGEGINEYGVDKHNGKVIVKVDPQFYRPCEVNSTVGNAEKAKTTLQWSPKTSFQELIKMMVEADYLKLM